MVSVNSSKCEIVGCVSCDCADDDTSCVWIEKMYYTDTDGDIG